MSGLKLGVSQQQPCNYLPDRQERLLFTLPDEPLDAQFYQQLLTLNFRRSGEQIYTTYCEGCQQCQSVRLEATAFQFNSSQRRVWNKAKRTSWRYQLVQHSNTEDCTEKYYALYQCYIDSKHAESSMSPTSPEQMTYLWQANWLKIQFLEQYMGDDLVAVTVVDTTADAFSAVYTFYQTGHTLAFGTLAILALIEQAKIENINFVYLGYYIQHCQKMNYKAKFLPQQRFIAGEWHSFR
ncbi:arginyltransferase [Rheinheimera sediminis]|uniref:arginyltransferase n=1 Tax=Rheinheimera sp. YQF-1 TaxID=2499626 RepID=UPI000FDB6042|nr:arginyltransferase [Rheinheimera sp. YQF-1]RVT49084.1 arginyltransferase [Rheinheimera sp. YQF-1]